MFPGFNKTVIGISLILVTAVTSIATPPVWWTEQGVLNSEQNQDNRAAITVGQVKNMAAKAMEEMEENFPGGAGTIIREMVGTGEPPIPSTSFRAKAASDNQLAAATVGQVKSVAKCYYDRLFEIGLRTLTEGYPWSETSPSEENLALVNAGQLKNVFSFPILDLTLPEEEDQDGDGLPDAWEIANGLNPNDPTDAWVDSDGDGLTNIQEYNLGLNPLSWGLPNTSLDDYDGDGVIDHEDARPDDASISAMVISISEPANNSVLQ